MKYSDICNLFKNRSSQIRMAIRVSYCKPYIRRAINKWLKTRVEPDLTVVLTPKGMDRTLELSAQTLIHLYGMSPLDALLFIDWANRENKDIEDALKSLSGYSRRSSVTITDDMWKKIDPEVLREYDKLQSADMEQSRQLELEYNRIKDREIDE